MKTLTLVLGALLVVGASCIECEDGWEDIMGTCFRFHQEIAMPWADARTFCQEEGAELATVVDGDMMRGFYEYVLTYGLSGTFWLGGNDLTFEGDWKWVADDSRVPKGTPFWAIHNGILGWGHEPNGAELENCMGLDEARKYYFNDLDCNLVHHPVCQK